MKRLIAVFVFLLITSRIFAQQEVFIKFITLDANGKEKIMIVSDSSGTNYRGFPVNIVGGNFVPSSVDSAIAARLLIIDQNEKSRYTYTKRGDSLANAGDSLSSGSLTTWGQLIFQSLGDTLEVAYNRTFTNSVLVYPSTTYTSTKESILQISPYIYIRGYGGGSLANGYQLILKGY